MVRVKTLAIALAALTEVFAIALPHQAAFTTSSKKQVPLGITWQETVSIPTIDSWALNPVGDAAVIRVSTLDVDTAETSYDLHLLAINAQFTIPSVFHGPTHPDAFYTFLSDDTFATLSPSPSDPYGHTWELAAQYLNYTSLPPAFPPHAGEAKVLKRLQLGGKPKGVVFAAKAGVLAVSLDRVSSGAGGPLVLVGLQSENGEWKAEEVRYPLKDRDLVVEEVVASDELLAFTAHSASRPWNSTRSILYTLDPTSPDPLPKQISLGQNGAVSSPAIGADGRIAWLEQREDGNARGQRKLWMSDAEERWEVGLDFELSPVNVLFSKNGEALYLLTLHDQAQSLFHLWTPSPPSASDIPSHIVPTRIPSNGTIHSTPIHVGITPLDHAHLVGVMSSLTAAPEFWVISHSPHSDPTYNYENIRLTYFTEEVVGKKRLSAGEKFGVINGVGDEVRGRVFLPDVVEGERVPVLLYIHGDEEGGAWHDWWMQYWNPNAMLAEGYAVVTVNPTGAEGYSNHFTQSRRHRWPSQPLSDLSLSLNHAVTLHPQLDTSRVFVLGYGAFGGFAVHWIQGHAEEFGVEVKGAVSHGGLVSPRRWAAEAKAGVAGEGAGARVGWEFGGEGEDDEESPLSKWDPEKSAGKWKTPELVITDGGNDGDIAPPSQSYAAYALLQSRGIKSRLVVTDGWAPIEWHEAIFDFFTSL
ncbi:hypothetical protein IAT38_006417 [Cryptococcus sp. DSM 104549]